MPRDSAGRTCRGASCDRVSSTPDTNVWVTNGNVYSIAAAPDGSAYIGGSFTYVGPVTGGGAMVSAASGALKSRLGKGPGGVEVAVPDGKGGYYIGGDFVKAGGLTRRHIAHILASGAVDRRFNPNANSTVFALAVSGSTALRRAAPSPTSAGKARSTSPP